LDDLLSTLMCRLSSSSFMLAAQPVQAIWYNDPTRRLCTLKTSILLASFLSLFLLVGCPAPQSESPRLIKLDDPLATKKSKGGELSAEQLALLDSADGIPFSIKDECSRQICGEPNQTADPSDIIYGSIKNSKEAEQLLEEVHSELNQIFDLKIEFEQKKMARIQSKLASFQGLKLSQKYKIMYNLMWTTSFLGQESNYLQGSHPRDFSIDDRQFLKATPAFSSSDRDNMKEFLLDLLNSTEFANRVFISDVGLKDYLKIEYPEMSMGRAQIVFANKVIESIVSVQNLFPEINLKVPEELRQLQSGAHPTPEIIRESSQAIMISYYARMLAQESSLYAKREINIKDILNSVQAHQTLENSVKSLNNLSNVTAAREKGFGDCRQALTRTLLAAPSLEEIAAAKEMIPLIKAAVLKTTEKMPSTNLIQKALSNRLHEMHFNFPADRAEMRSSIKAAIQRDLNVNRAALTNLPRLTDESLLLGLSISDLHPDFDYGTAVSKNCEIYSPQTMSDKSIDQTSAISLSWQSVRFPNIGAGVLAHELGHVVSHVFSTLSEQQQARYRSIRSCENARHQAEEMTIPDQFNEEDFADTIAARTISEIENQSLKTGNFGCALLGKSKDRWGTQLGLSMKLPLQSKDSHSAGLYRTLQIQINMGRPLPTACQSIIETYQPNAQKQCMN
jgi:hypothetical protein